jgi:hypothetical protein
MSSPQDQEAIRTRVPAHSSEEAPRDRALRDQALRDQALRHQAWIGDAVLTLYARRRILREDGKLDGEKAVRMSSNQFLAAFGEPTAVEAGIGRVFEKDGLDVAFAHIESTLIPLFARQEEKRLRKAGKAPR